LQAPGQERLREKRGVASLNNSKLAEVIEIKLIGATGVEPPTFWFAANGVKMLNALFGVAYGLETPFFPQLAAPNLAPKTEQHRARIVHFIG
jgi:hypothetical protein